MKSNSLRPHAFSSGPVHGRHHAWLSSFSPRERHELLEDDLQARSTTSGVLFGAMVFGLISALITLFVLA